MNFSETRRQFVHMAMGLFALLLRVLTWPQAAACALAAFLFNLVVLPRLGGPSLYRPVDAARGFPLGILIYPLSVLLLILSFPRRPDIVAAAWACLAYGDGMATLVGRLVKSPRLPWNAQKTLAGTASFVLAGGVVGILLVWWTRPAVSPMPPWQFVVFAPLAAALGAGLVESMPVSLDDNLSVPIVAAAILWGVTLVTSEAWHAAVPTLAWMVPLAVAFNGVVATLGWKAGTVSVAGAIGGAIIGVAILACAGFSGWVMLFASFFAAAVSSKMGLKRKSVLGIAEERGGRRGPGNAIANCGLAAAVAILAALSSYREAALLALVAALTAGASDTVASEIGKAWGRRTFLLTRLTPVRPGTPGAVSLEGTAAGLVAALALAALGLALGLIHGNAIWYVVVGATVGAFVEGGLAATLEGPGILNNDMLNFINTAVAAIVALACAGALT
jgi:uncharacterized protein (TIGR00297 family)